MNQTYQEFELIIVDDGSTDNTEEVVRSFNDKRLLYIRLKENSGGSAVPRNTGLQTAKGEYVAALDDDYVWLDKDKLKKQVEFLDAHPDYVLVGTNSIAVDENNNELACSHLPEIYEEIRSELLKRNCFIHGSVMFRKSAATIVGGYSKIRGTRYSNYSHDYDLWLKLGTIGKFANLPIHGVQYVAIPVILAKKSRISLCLKAIRLIARYRNNYPNYWRALSLRLSHLFAVVLDVISDVPPFLIFKNFLKNKCPACWRAITYIHRIIFQGIFTVF